MYKSRNIKSRKLTPAEQILKMAAMWRDAKIRSNTLADDAGKLNSNLDTRTALFAMDGATYMVNLYASTPVWIDEIHLKGTMSENPVGWQAILIRILVRNERGWTWQNYCWYAPIKDASHIHLSAFFPFTPADKISHGPNPSCMRKVVVDSPKAALATAIAKHLWEVLPGAPRCPVQELPQLYPM